MNTVAALGFLVVFPVGLIIWWFADNDCKKHPDWDRMPARVGARLAVGGFVLGIGGLVIGCLA